MMDVFGYERDGQNLSIPQRLQLGLTVPLESSRLIAWRIRESFRDRAGRPVPAYRLVERVPAA
jgi:hypothetical protein